MITLLSLLYLAESLETISIPPSQIGPEAREKAVIGFNPSSNNLLLFGGFSSVYFNDLWSFCLNSLQWRILYPNSISPSKI